MIRSILVVCVGNICRSPAAERLLARSLPGVSISSAGLGALAGHEADSTMKAVAVERGVSLDGHRARQYTPKLGSEADLILVMEAGHRRQIIAENPQLAGRVMLFDHWSGARGIADPYRKGRSFHERIFSELSASAEVWAARITPKE